MSTLKPQPACPECEKLVSVSEKFQMLGYFLDWMQSVAGIHLAVWEDGYSGTITDSEGNEEDFQGTLVSASKYKGDTGINKLLAEYFEIDLDKVEQERRALIEWLREVQS